MWDVVAQKAVAGEETALDDPEHAKDFRHFRLSDKNPATTAATVILHRLWFIPPRHIML